MKKKVKFLVLHLGYGGIETATINTANSLSEKYNVEIISFYNLYSNQELKISNNVSIKYLYNGEPNKKEILINIKKLKFISLFKEIIKAINILYLKKKIIKEEIKKSKNCIMISTRMEYSILLSKYGHSSVTKIAQEHCYHQNNKKYIGKIRRKYNNIDYLLALTKTLENDYKKFLNENSHTKVVLIPNMLVEYPKIVSNVKNNNIISVSRLHKNKRVTEIIDIFNNIKDKKNSLFIVGDGEEKNNLILKIKKYHLNNQVEMFGNLPFDRIKELFLKSSVFVMASITEALPMVLLEAMSYGIPCIAYRTPSGVSDIIKNGVNGFIIENRNDKDYCKKLELLLKDKKLREQFSENAVITAKEFSKEKILKKWEDILK